MSEPAFLDFYLGLYAFVFVGIILVFVYARKRLFKYGEKAKGIILDWEEVRFGSSYTDELQSLSKPIVSFTTKDGRNVTGTPVAGFSDSEEPVNIYVTVYYDPAKPTVFAVKM